MPTIPPDEIEIEVEALAECMVSDEDGKTMRLKELWADGPAILVFLRHFACIACRAHASDVWKNRAKLEKSGAKIRFIGVGSPEYIKTFKEDLSIGEAHIVTDPSLISFRIAGFKRGFLNNFGPRSIINSINLSRRGFKFQVPEARTGDTWQLGGTLVVSQNGRVTYQFISEVQGDFAPEKDFE
jgi:peroxiredoxin